MAATGRRSLLTRAWARFSAFVSETLALSAEAGCYPDPLHLGPVLGVLYSSEGRSERRNADFGASNDAEHPT